MKKNVLLYSGLFLLICACYIGIGHPSDTTMLVIGMLVTAFAWGAFSLAYLQNPTMFVLGCGVILRIGYMLYTPLSVRTHDLGQVSLEGRGHAAYLLQIIKNNQLPQAVNGQFYQQPLFYLCAGLISKVINSLRHMGDNPEVLVDTAKVFTTFCSVMVMFVAKQIGETLGLEKKTRVLALTYVAFMPSFFITCGVIGPDAFATLWISLTLLYLIRWNQQPGYRETALLALCFGCGVMTKISCALLAPLTVVVVAVKFWKVGEKKARLRIACQTAMFAVIALPLGLWKCLRDLIVYDKKIMYVPNAISDLSTAGESVFARVIGFNFQMPFRSSNPYADVWNDYNAPSYYLKSALFGEFKFQVPFFIPVLLTFVTVVLSVCLVASVIRIIWKKDQGALIYGGAFAIAILSAYSFYLKMPFGCSMDYRYMNFITIPAGILLGKYCTEGRFGKVAAVMMYSFAVLSSMMYVVVGIF